MKFALGIISDILETSWACEMSMTKRKDQIMKKQLFQTAAVLFVFGLSFTAWAQLKLSAECTKDDALFKTGADVEIHWYYQQDDEDMLDQGEYFRDLVDLPFKFFPLEN